MEKYVAFLDILGFKSKIRSLKQREAKKYISDFSSTIYRIWKNYESTELAGTRSISGYIVSDSLLIYTTGVEDETLKRLFKIISEICKAEFKDNGVLIRGAVAKGEFNRLEAVELARLEKGLIVGQAYLDAYSLEGAVKTLGIGLSREVYIDYLQCNLPEKEVFQEKTGGKPCYIYRYIDADFLLDKDNLLNFTKLAARAGWLPHYYNALYFALKNESPNKKMYQIFENIVGLIIGDKPLENCGELDGFIRNSFSTDVISEYQTMFLEFLRDKLYKKSDELH